MKMTMLHRKKQKGISLLEVLLSLTIIAIILVMAVRYFFIAENNNRINTTRQQVGSILAAINGWKGEHPTYESLTFDELYNTGWLSKTSNMVVTGSIPQASVKMYDPWGQQILMTVNPSTTNTTITISTNLPTFNDCVSLRNSYPTADACTQGTGAFKLTVS